MTLPFTLEQFLSVFECYNLAVQPMQVLLNLIALAIIVLIFQRAAWRSRVIASLLAFLWAWTGIAYHLVFFAAINPAAVPFGILCIIQAAILLVFGGLMGKLAFRNPSTDWRWITGAGLIAYALVIYPLLGIALGHSYPSAPTFGLPCPTTIFTIGLMFMAFPTTRWYVLVIPLAWSFVGGSAAFKLGIREDIGLLVSGLLILALFFRPRGVSVKA